MSLTARAGPIITQTCIPWEEFLSYGVRREVQANSTLLSPGDSVESLYYIASGEILISIFSSPETIDKLFILRDGSMLGLIGFFGVRCPTLASWLTLKPCTLYLFDKKAVYESLPRHLLLSLLEQFGSMSKAMTRRVCRGSVKRHDVRLARLLLHLAEACSARTSTEGTVKIIPNVTQEMAGELLGMHPVTLNRLLSFFRKKGMIGRFNKKTLEILDMKRLLQYADTAQPAPDLTG